MKRLKFEMLVILNGQHIYDRFGTLTSWNKNTWKDNKSEKAIIWK